MVFFQAMRGEIAHSTLKVSDPFSKNIGQWFLVIAHHKQLDLKSWKQECLKWTASVHTGIWMQQIKLVSSSTDSGGFGDSLHSTLLLQLCMPDYVWKVMHYFEQLRLKVEWHSLYISKSKTKSFIHTWTCISTLSTGKQKCADTG